MRCLDVQSTLCSLLCGPLLVVPECAPRPPGHTQKVCPHPSVEVKTQILAPCIDRKSTIPAFLGGGELLAEPNDMGVDRLWWDHI